MRLSKAERETIITFSEADSIATVYTFNTRLKNKLGKLSQEHSGEILLLSREELGSVTYSVPKNLISIRAPVSAEQKQLARVNAVKYGFGRKSKANTHT